MKSALALVAYASLFTLVVASPHDIVHQHRDAARANSARTCSAAWEQKFRGTASFTASSSNSNCKQAPACGESFSSGFTAAVNELAFGAQPNNGPGDACGRCFYVKPLEDPSESNVKLPSGLGITVKVNNLCTSSSGSTSNLCGQTVSHRSNELDLDVHFELCAPSGAWDAFYPGEQPRTMIGKFHEVSCDEWEGSQGNSLWDGSCMAPANPPFWPKTACGNKGCAPP
ncbi:endoglucanase V-like protein [Russula ochroleuca]|jgi:hypothetical protein|uniref:Endoglucanase V-like protein n=1 Tax=Russula ochroleuca TaxID=152965 RepID=A0A9P5T918_9AGAM|nr:endoglucanase V-like protein [Russula ochroleuca]